MKSCTGRSGRTVRAASSSMPSEPGVADRKMRDIRYICNCFNVYKSGRNVAENAEKSSFHLAISVI